MIDETAPRLRYRVRVPGLTYPALSDGVIVLRQWEVDDAAEQLAAFTDPLFVQYSDWAPITLDQVVERITVVDRARDDGTGVHLAIADANDPRKILGEVSLHSIESAHQRAGMGYWLAPSARGRGAATRAVKLLADWAFADLGLARLEITCGPDNVGSQRVALRCGFRREGLLRSHMSFKGGRRDTVVFGLVPPGMNVTST